MPKRLLLLALLAALLTACGASSTAAPTSTLLPTAAATVPAPAPLPTYTPYPTYTPLPTYTPIATSAVANAQPMLAGDLATDGRLAAAINAYRVANGQPALQVSAYLANIAASRVYLKMITRDGQELDLGQIQIDPRTMPADYAWRELSFGGNTELALQMVTPEAALAYMQTVEGWPAHLLQPELHDIGAAQLCNGARCGFIVILGQPN